MFRLNIALKRYILEFFNNNYFNFKHLHEFFTLTFYFTKIYISIINFKIKKKVNTSHFFSLTGKNESIVSHRCYVY